MDIEYVKIRPYTNNEGIIIIIFFNIYMYVCIYYA